MSGEKGKGVCMGCGGKMTATAVVANDKIFHPECFKCAECTKPIEQSYLEEDGKIYCPNCHAQKFNPKCNKCGETVVGPCTSALDKKWHSGCFLCHKCSKPFPDGKFFVVDEKAFHLDCHWAQRLENLKTDAQK